MSFKITIRWGMPSSEQEPTTYEFATQAELTAFMLGVEECDGWMEYEVIEFPNNQEITI
jgi:hypothetical protein